MKIKSILTIRSVSIIVLCLSLSPAFSQNFIELKSPEEKPKTKVYMWKLQSYTSTAYLLGSVHKMPVSIYPLDSRIEKAFNKAEVLVVEANILTPDKNLVQKLILNKGLYPKGKTVKDYIRPKSYNKLLNYLKQFKLNISDYEKFKAWLIASVLPAKKNKKLQVYSNYGIDYYFMQKAMNKGMKIKELEGIEYQFNLFNSLSSEKQEKFLLYTMENRSKIHIVFPEIIKAWQSGNYIFMEDLTSKYIKLQPELSSFYNKVVYSRNVNMVKKIESYMKTDKIHFIIIGAGHYGSRKGLLYLLRKKGYRLIQQ